MWLTQFGGIIKTIIKGGAKNNVQGLDLFDECNLLYNQSRTTHLHALTEVEIIKRHKEIRSNYLKVLCLTYFSELIVKLVEVDTPIPEFHEVYKLSLNYLREHEVSTQFVQRFEQKIVKMMGLYDGKDSKSVLIRQAGVLKSYDLLNKELNGKQTLKI
jgi:DNA repair protein RecO